MQKPVNPSRLLLLFFRWFCDPRIAEDLEGDLLERFEIRLSKKGQRKAKWLFIKDVLQLFRPGIIRNFEGIQKLNNIDMFKNYFKTARRSLLRQKVYSTIKIGGFAIGIAVCLLISLFIRDELSYNQHIPDHENMYMAVVGYEDNGDIEKYTWFAPPFAQALLEDFPEVLQSGRMLVGEGFGAGSANIRKEGEITNYFEDGFAYADQSILQLFDFPMVYGNQSTALSDPQTIVLTKSKADMLFPGINPVGETVYIDDNVEKPYRIGGVIEDLSTHGTVQFNYLMSLKNREFWPNEQRSWGSTNYQVFMRLKEGTDLDNFQPRLKTIGQKYILPTYKKAGYTDAEELVKAINFYAVPMADLHLHSADVEMPFEKSDINYVLTFGLIALFILGLACINFVNLSTAKSANRAKEVGLRKTIGSGKSQLIAQFLTESVMYSTLSFIIAVGLCSLLLPYFNQLAQKSIVLPWNTYWFAPLLLTFAVLIGLVAGVYPAFYLSSFKPVAVLKGKLAAGSKSSSLRNTLVVIQFTASIVLIIGTFVVYQQMEYILNRKVGFDKDQVMTIESPYLLGDNLQSFDNALEAMSQVKSTTYTGFLPIAGTSRNGNTWWNEGRTKVDPAEGGQHWFVDHDYIKTLGMKLAAGRNFSKELSSDSVSVIINESMAKALGITDDPLGKRITNVASNRLVYNVIGVVEDFHHQSLTEPLTPLAMRLGNNTAIGAIKLETSDLAATIEDIRALWQEMAPGQPFIHSFMDERFSKMYANVARTRNILSSFAILAVVIACLGLFGLSVFMVEQRKKEISVRLALGARTSQIVQLLSVTFMRPIFLALILSIPIAWYAMQQWLNGFEYSAGLNVMVFVLAGLSAMFIAMSTISFQSVKAALSNPVDGLRNE